MPYIKSTVAVLWLAFVAVRGPVAAGAGTEAFDPLLLRDRAAELDRSSMAALVSRIDPATRLQADAAVAVDPAWRSAAGGSGQRPGVWALLVTGAFGAAAIIRRRALPLTDPRIGRTRLPL
jgi:hypothetical protein